jgi:hypothetical protein
MDNETDHLDRADEDILNYTISDEALEAAAGTEWGGVAAAARSASSLPPVILLPCCLS